MSYIGRMLRNRTILKNFSRAPDRRDPIIHDYSWNQPLPPHTATRLPALSPSHSSLEHVRSSRFFQSSELANVSSSVLNSEKMLREATRIIFRFARLSATVRRRGSSRNSHEASR